MHDPALLHQRESEEHLVSVSSNGFDVETDVLSEPLDDVSEVHAVEREGVGISESTRRDERGRELT